MRHTEGAGVGSGALTSATLGDPRETVEVAAGEPQLAADHLAALTAKAAGANCALVQLREAGVLRLIGGFQLPAGWDILCNVSMNATLAGLIFETGRPITINDLDVDPRVPADAPARTVGMRSYAGYPITDRLGVVVGICCVLDDQPREWTAKELDVLDHAAQACGALVAEQEARRAADRDRRFLDAVVESLRSAVLACDETGVVVLHNAAMRQLSPSPIEQFRVGHTTSATGRFHPDGRPMTPRELPLARALRGERIRQVEVLMRRPGRPDRLVLVDGQPVANGQGRQLGAVVAFTDITERRRAERCSNCELRVATVLAESSRVEHVAPNVAAAVGATLGWPYVELWLLDQLGGALQPAASWAAARHAPLAMPEELPCGTGLAGTVCADGETRWVTDMDAPNGPISGVTARSAGLRTALAVPVRSGPGTLGALVIFSDAVEPPDQILVTTLSSVAAHIGQFIERRRAEELELQLAQSKDEYLALVGHELRTPLTSIGAYASLIEEADQATFAAEGRDMVKVIARNAAALREIVDDLLDLAALDTGHAIVKRDLVDLAQLVRDSVADAGPGIAQARLVATVRSSETLRVYGDHKRLRQVVDSLLGNAIKYTPAGGRIALTVSVITGSVAELTVSDTGIGIPAEERDRLFERFYRSSRARERGIPGAGLSLAISRAIMRRHGGSIVMVPGQGPGTRIAVRLPLASDSPARAA